MSVLNVRELTQDTWLTSEAAANYIGVNYSHFRHAIIPQLVASGVDGVGRIGEGPKAPWRFKVSALDEFLELMAGGEKDG